MKLQFSLGTMLVCVTVLAVVLSYCINAPFVERVDFTDPRGPFSPDRDFARFKEVSIRFLRLGPPALIATLGVLWAIRRLKPRRENGPQGE
jgi:hypothetical protein